MKTADEEQIMKTWIEKRRDKALDEMWLEKLWRKNPEKGSGGSG